MNNIIVGLKQGTFSLQIAVNADSSVCVHACVVVCSMPFERCVSQRVF